MGIELLGKPSIPQVLCRYSTFAGHEDISYWLTSTLNIGAGTTFTIPAGASFKFSSNPNPCFNVLGTLNIAERQIRRSSSQMNVKTAMALRSILTRTEP